jgi:hypothetical protein
MAGIYRTSEVYIDQMHRDQSMIALASSTRCRADQSKPPTTTNKRYRTIGDQTADGGGDWPRQAAWMQQAAEEPAQQWARGSGRTT